MPSQSLSQLEAVARRALLEVTSYDVSLDLASDESTFASTVTITFDSQGGLTFVDLNPTSVREARLNDRPIDVDLLAQGRLPIDTVAGTNILVIDAVMPFRNDGEGLHQHVDPADGRRYVYGMSFMDAAPTVFACFDQPDLKAPFTFHVRAPHDWVVIGNAPATNTEPGAWEVGPTQPLSTYFVTIVAGPYHVIRDEHDGIPLGLSSRQSIAPHLDKDAEELFTLTRQCFDEFHRLVGIRYPFGDYHQAFVPEFNAAGMENPGCVTLSDDMVFETRASRGAQVARAVTVAHEMAHQWFGDIVTPTWWDDLWLNESYAEYLGNRVVADVTQYADAWTFVSWTRRQWGLVSDTLSSTHPVAGNRAEDASTALQSFDGVSYVKGANILKQLCASLGDEVFFAGGTEYLTRHRFGNATMNDLVASWERAGSGQLAPVVEQWLHAAGVDTFTFDRTTGVLHHEPPADHPTVRSHRFKVARLINGAVLRTPVHVTGPDTAVPELAGAPGAVIIDPDEESWGVYVPDSATVTALRDELPLIKDDGLRAAAWNNVKSGYRSLQVAPDAVVDLLLASLPVQDTDGHTPVWILDEVLPAASAGAAARVHSASCELVLESPAGSESQLAAFRLAIATAEEAVVLRTWLARPPDGLQVDVDLRWRLLGRLAILGATDAAELDHELARGQSTTARRGHSAASAAIPTAEAKHRAWQLFTGAVPAANTDVEDAGLGFWQWNQTGLCAPYVERYFADLPGTVDVRSGHLLVWAARVFFPITSTEPSTLARARELHDRDILTGGLQRALQDQIDRLGNRIAVRTSYPRINPGNVRSSTSEPSSVVDTRVSG